MRRPAFHIPAPLWLRIAFVLPFIVVAGLVALHMSLPATFAAILNLGLAGVVLWETPGKHPALVVALFLWLVLILGLANLVAVAIPIWGAGFLALALTFVAVACAVRIGAPWGYARAQRFAEAGRPVREWEWVQTDAAFALTHPLAKLSGGLLVMIGFIVVQWLVWLTSAVWVQVGWIGWSVFAVLTFLSLMTLYALICLKPGARALMWVHLALWFPLTLPLVVYWADGVRPNLIYGRRFERLVPLRPETTGAEG